MADGSGRLGGLNTLGVGVLLLVVGAGLAGYGVSGYVQQTAAVENAVAVDATVSEVGAERIDLKHEPHVEFTYEYMGQSYTGTNLSPTDTETAYKRRSEAVAAVDEYEPGETVTAYVDPADPDSAFLERRQSTVPLGATGIGVPVALVGAVALLREFELG